MGYRTKEIQLTAADDLRKLVGEFRSLDVPLRTQALVQQVVRAMAERIERMARE